MLRRLAPLTLLTLSLAACDFGPSDDEDGMSDPAAEQEADEEDGELLAEIAAESGDGVSGESALVATVSTAAAEAAAEGASSGEQVAEAAADSVTVMCAYGGTASATVTGNEVTYSFWQCSSHCGMHRATGDIVVTYDVIDGGVSVEIEAKDFRIDGTRTDLDVSAEYRALGSVAELSVDTEASTTGLFGNRLSRSGQYDATFDAASLCITHEGQWTTALDEHAYTTTLEDYRRCALQCPDQGSRISIEATSGYTLEAEFTSPTTLEWGSSTGYYGMLELPACGG